MLSLLLSLAAPAQALTLEEAWASAASDGKELALLEEQRLQSDTLRTQAWALVSPKVVAAANYTINQREGTLAFDFSSFLDEDSLAMLEQFGIEFAEPEPIVVNPKTMWDWNASIVQPIFSGQAIPLLRAAYATVDAGREQERAARADVKAGIARAYWGVLVAREGKALAAQALANAEAHAKIAATNVEVGTAAPSVRLQAELGVARARREVARAEAGVVTAEEAFARLTDLAPTSSLEMPGARALPFDGADAAIERALGARPELAAAEAQERAARGQAVASHLAWLPTVDGRFTQSFTENDFFTGNKYNWQVVFTANWTIWDGGARIAQEQKAASMARAAELARELAADQAREEIRALWAGYERATAAVAAMDAELAMARENLRLAEAAFAAGTLSYLEVEDARLGLEASQLTELTERMNRDLAVIDLLAATGQL